MTTQEKRNQELKYYIKQSINMNVGIHARIKAKPAFLKLFSK